MKTILRCCVAVISGGALLLTGACGGGGSSSSSSGNNSNNTVSNTVTVTVGPGPSTISPYVNGVFVSVTVCAPGSTSQCATVPNVLLDTGSSGLRILQSALGTLSLSTMQSGGNTITNCTQYVDLTYNWGPVALADVKMGGETASSVPIQIIADPVSTFPTAPDSCSNGGTANNTLDSLSANGILGVSSFLYDCGTACAPGTPSNAGVYYSCATTSCQQTTASLANQLQNPVALFSSDNNGISITLPSLSASGVPSTTGTLTFGIGTQTNNQVGSATVQTEDASGSFTTVFNSKSYPRSFIDTGSNAIYFLDSATTGIPECKSSPGFYCPTSTTNLSATNQGANGKTASVSFSVANADSLPLANWVFDDLAGTSSFTGTPGSGLPSLYFDWGLPFFFGRTVFVAIEGRSTPAGAGPYWAY